MEWLQRADASPGGMASAITTSYIRADGGPKNRRGCMAVILITAVNCGLMRLPHCFRVEAESIS